jgi:quercetin dioxygenase-like cupin family protein
MHPGRAADRRLAIADRHDRRKVAMKIVRAADRATKPAPASNFTRVVFQDEVVAGVPPSRLRASVVSFTPGARTAWHAHPVGQTLYCLSGIGRVQREGEPVQALHPGDTVLIPPDLRHWHGAAPDRLFAHLAISENGENGEGTAWFEPVAEADYAARPA